MTNYKNSLHNHWQKMATLIAEMNSEEMDLPGTHIREVNHSKVAQSWLQFCDEIQLTCCLSQKKTSYLSPALPLFVQLDMKKKNGENSFTTTG